MDGANYNTGLRTMFKETTELRTIYIKEEHRMEDSMIKKNT